MAKIVQALSLILLLAVSHAMARPLRKREIIVDNHGFYLGGGSNANIREASQRFDVGGPIGDPWIGPFSHPIENVARGILMPGIAGFGVGMGPMGIASRSGLGAGAPGMAGAAGMAGPGMAGMGGMAGTGMMGDMARSDLAAGSQMGLQAQQQAAAFQAQQHQVEMLSQRENALQAQQQAQFQAQQQALQAQQQALLAQQQQAQVQAAAAQIQPAIQSFGGQQSASPFTLVFITDAQNRQNALFKMGLPTDFQSGQYHTIQ